MDSWVLGMIIFELLFGSRPQLVEEQEPSQFHSGDLISKEVFERMVKQLLDLVDLDTLNPIQQLLTQLSNKSLGSFIKDIFGLNNTNYCQLEQLIDLMCACLQFHPHQRPTLQAISKSGILHMQDPNAIQIA